MSYELSVNELRVLGALIEKQLTTPDQYPLTLKALMSACNQKSNRDPVLSLDEATVRQSVDILEARYLVSKRTEYGSRVTKHRQRFCNTEFGTLKFEPEEVALMCVLMLRGAQTPGELRGRTARMHNFADADDVTETLELLALREDGPFVVRLEREPGRREARYMHLLGDEAPEAASPPRTPAVAKERSAGRVMSDSRIETLENTVTDLATRVAELERKIARLDPEG